MARVPALVTALALLGATPTRAADTVEPFEVGASNVELYLGRDGPADSSGRGIVWADMLLGFGLVDGVSAYLGTTLAASDALLDSGNDLYLGLFGTAADSEHVDVDLGFQLLRVGETDGPLEAMPFVELNIDVAPDLAVAGTYLRLGAPVYGHTEDGRRTTGTHVSIQPGAYVTLGDRHQLLVEVDAEAHVLGPDPDRLVPGVVALGYNLTLSPALEVITQVSAGLPKGDEPIAFGASVGLIASLPASGAWSVAAGPAQETP